MESRGNVFWLTGLSGAGKTTLAKQVKEKMLENKYMPIFILDGDVLRTGLNSDLGFSIKDRSEGIRRTSELTKILSLEGFLIIVAQIAPLRSQRDHAKQIIGERYFHEIYINCPIEICEKRDVKGLYHKARIGQITDFTGVNSPYEPPMNPNFTINTHYDSVEQSVQSLLTYIKYVSK